MFQAPTQTRLHFIVLPFLLQKVSEKSFLNLLFVVLTTKSRTIELVSVANTTPSTGNAKMVTAGTVKRVQSKLNKCSVYILSCFAREARKSGELELMNQAYAAMSPAFDCERLSDSDSKSILERIDDGEWA